MSKLNAATGLVLLVCLTLPAFCSYGEEDTPVLPTYAEFLRNSAVAREVIDRFLDPAEPTWSQFDPELGYILGNAMPRDGMDGSRTLSTVQANGARTSHFYTDSPCRINTYGNSFTQCHQVNDGETWQEYLAAHFGEPIRNFGMGGYGTYQAYRRMLREEQSDHGAEYVILYLWGDDHLRSVMRCRHALIYPVWDHQGGRMFHNNFWANIELDLDTGEWVERENLLPTRESLYKMCDPDFMEEALRDDLIAQLYAAVNQWVRLDNKELDRIDQLAKVLGVAATDRTSGHPTHASLNKIMQAYGHAATKHILDLAAAFCRKENKKLLILTLCPRATLQALRGEPRYDQTVIDYLAEKKFHYVDMNLAHVRDYAAFNLRPEEYMKRYFIGHYSPSGNHFFAFQLKDTLVEWLDPKPITYQTGEWNLSDFQGYLPETGSGFKSRP